MASSRRTSPAHMNRQAKWVQPTMGTEGADTGRQQKRDETINKGRRDTSEITRKHLEQVISSMIPSSTCSSSDLMQGYTCKHI